MRYLLHHSDATFDSTTKRWVFKLDKRISNPRTIGVKKCCFTAASTEASYPPVVYMRSDTLHNLARRKHSVEVKSSGHEDSSNVIAVLEETHTKGRYAMRDAVVFAVHGHTAHTREFDIYFTDGTTVLAGRLDLVDPGAAVSALSPKVWVKWDDTIKIIPANITEGDSVTSITSQVNGITLAASAAGLNYSAFGETQGVTSTVSWHAMSGGSQGENETADAILSFMFRVPANVYMRLIQTECFKPVNNYGVMAYYDDQNAVQSTSLVIAPQTDYLVQIRRTAAAGQNVPATFDWVLIRLSDNATQTESTDAGLDPDTNGFTTAYATAQSGFNGGSFSHAVLVPVNTDAAALTVKNYMLENYNGTVTYEDGDHATFFVELDIKAQNR